MKTVCPKCGSASAWHEATKIDILLRCICGYCKVVHTKLEVLTLDLGDDEDEAIRIPKKETYLWITLRCLEVLQPATTATITNRLLDLGKSFSVSDVASYLTILRSKGLVQTTKVRRGIVGGSTWILTEKCATTSRSARWVSYQSE